MKKNKLLIITPHLSTGGAPQVTLNKIELLKNDFEIKCVEYSLIAWTFIVQRNKIIELLGNNFHSLGENKGELLTLIASFDPDVISFEEFPEFFMDDSITKEIYKKERSYKIFETTHDSSFPVSEKRWFPDKFIFVSAFNAFRYVNFDVPFEIVEYPIDKKTKDKKNKQSLLNLNPDWKHVVNVGLFTPRKNQKYLFQLAEYLKDYKIKFHFIGNQADNFKFYWQPLMENKPDNCVIWYERNDVQNFLESADMFFFASKGDKNNKELNPIAIKEALEYDMPIMMYNLDVYCGKYNSEENITFLTGDLYKDAENLVNLLNPTKDSKDDEAIIISTYPNTLKRNQLTIDCVESFRKLNKKIILVSHCPVSTEIQEIVDYYVFDKNNAMIPHSFYNYFYNYTDNYDVNININNLSNSNQSLAAHINFFNGVKLAKELGFKKVMIVTYDVILNEQDIPSIVDYFNKLSEWKCCLAFMDTELGKGVETTSMVFNVDYFLRIFKDIRNENEFNSHCESLGCHNFLEHYYMKLLKDEDGLWIVPNQKTILPNSGIGVSSNSEYLSVLCVDNNPSKWMIYFFSYNLDNRKIEVLIEEESKKIYQHSFIVSQSREYMKQVNYNNSPIEITINFYDDDILYKSQKFDLNENTIEKYKGNGFFNEKKKKDYNIKLVHLQTTLNDEREVLSRESLSPLNKFGINYVLHTNEPYTQLPPVNNCLRPQCVSEKLFTEEEVQKYGTALTPSHYGCFESFKNAIINEFTEYVDFLILCEGDCKLEVSHQEFVSTLYQVIDLVNQNNISYFSFGDKDTLDFGWRQSNVIEEIPNQNLIYITNHIIGLQCIMFKNSDRMFLIDQVKNHKWDASDMFFNVIFNEHNKKMGILKERITSQYNGYSLIDNQYKEFRKK